MTVRASQRQAASQQRTRRMLEAPILPLLVAMSWPNVLIMLAQASTGLIETWWIAKLGTHALAGMVIVFPPVILMQMISGGAMGGGISAAIARALGAGRQADADALVLHAILINAGLGLLCSAVFLIGGEAIYRLLGGQGEELEAALAYSDVIFSGVVLLWLMNGLASIIRGTGNMVVPAFVTCSGVILLIPLSPVLIFGLGPIPALGVAGAGAAMLIYYASGTCVLAWYILSGRNAARLRRTPIQWRLLKDILRVGLASALISIQTNVTIAGTTALVATTAGVAAVAGVGIGARLEFLLIPLIFGIGSPLVAIVGINIAAGQRERALRAALTGAGLAFLLTATIGIAAALWPQTWLGLFSSDPDMIASGATYLRIVGPCYGFFGLGLALYFASQGAGQLRWSLASGVARLAIALGGGAMALHMTGTVSSLFVAIGAAQVVFGMTIYLAVRSGIWLRP